MAKNAAKNAALATSSTALVKSKVQNDHQDAMEMEQQPLTASTEVQKLVSRPDTTFEVIPLEITELDEVERSADDTEQGSASSAATAAKASIMPLPSAVEIIAQGPIKIQKLYNMVAKKSGSSAALSASHVSAAPATPSSVSSGAEPKRLIRDEKDTERKAKEKAAAEAEANAEDKMDKASTSSSRDKGNMKATTSAVFQSLTPKTKRRSLLLRLRAIQNQFRSSLVEITITFTNQTQPLCGRLSKL